MTRKKADATIVVISSTPATQQLYKLAGLSIWYQGKPAPILTALNLGGIAPAVWAVATSGLTAAGTTGNRLAKSLTVPLFVGLK